MHFRSLLTVYLPAVEPDPEWEKEIAEQVENILRLIGEKLLTSSLMKRTTMTYSSASTITFRRC